MPSLEHPSRRQLLCASAAHCAQILHAAAQARVDLHGLLPATEWPRLHAEHSSAPDSPSEVLLWALVPAAQASLTQLALEARWRTHMLQGPHSPQWAVHMLYGSAAQQALQLAPWLHRPGQPSETKAQAHCWECVDPRSERQLFQHLLARS